MLAERSIETQSACLEWTGYLCDGYGRFWMDRIPYLAHRAAYELANGPIPPGLLVCHRCDNRRCIRSAHLFLGTPADNAQDMAVKCRANRPQGQRNASAKLDEAAIVAIRQSNAPARELASVHGVSAGRIRAIRRLLSWRHIYTDGMEHAASGHAGPATGPRNGLTKHTFELICQMREMRSNGAPLKQIAEAFGFNGTGYVSLVVNNKIRKFE